MPSDTDIENLQPFWAEVLPQAARTARSIAAEYPGVCISDIESEILADVAARVHRYQPAGARIRFLRMHQIGVQYAGAESYSYRHFNPEWLYTAAEVRGLFERYFDEDAWLDLPSKDKNLVTLESKGLVINLWDLREAYSTLSDKEQAIIRAKYDDDDPIFASDPTMRKGLSRAIEKVVRAINNKSAAARTAAADHDGPGARHAMSNDEARALTRSSEC